MHVATRPIETQGKSTQTKEDQQEKETNKQTDRRRVAPCMLHHFVLSIFLNVNPCLI